MYSGVAGHSYIVLLLASLAAAGCPSGFFQIAGSVQCFKFSSWEHKWDEAMQTCSSEGLRLAKPSSDVAVALRKKLLDDHGSVGLVWLGARRNSSDNVVWDQDDSVLHNSNPLWLQGQPATGQDDCLAIRVFDDAAKQQPQTPYRTWDCAWGLPTLCEADGQDNCGDGTDNKNCGGVAQNIRDHIEDNIQQTQNIRVNIEGNAQSVCQDKGICSNQSPAICRYQQAVSDCPVLCHLNTSCDATVCEDKLGCTGLTSAGCVYQGVVTDCPILCHLNTTCAAKEFYSRVPAPGPTVEVAVEVQQPGIINKPPPKLTHPNAVVVQFLLSAKAKQLAQGSSTLHIAPHTQLDASQAPVTQLT